MDDRIIQFRVGVVVIAAVLIAGTLALWFGEGVRSTYTLYLKHSHAPNVVVDTPVTKHGVRIGRVSQVDLLDDGVLLTMKIDQGRELRTSETPQIATASLLGDSVVQFVPRDAKSMPEEIRVFQDGETIIADDTPVGSPGEIMKMIVGMEDKITAAFTSVDAAGQKIAQLTDGLAGVVGQNDGQIKSMVAKSDRALEQLNQTLANVNDVIGDEELKQRLKQTVVELPAVLADARQTLSDARVALGTIERAGQRAESNLANLEGFTQPLGEHGEELISGLQRSVANVEEVLDYLVQFSQSINDPNGTIGHLVHDDELYHRLNRAAGNMEIASAKLKPILSDARILADKLARNPAQLGVRGALYKSDDGVKVPLISGRPWQRQP